MKLFHPCPKCGRRLSQSGTATVPDASPGGGVEELPVYQCDECIVDWEPEPGEVIPCALTFAVDGQGRALHPDTGQPITMPA